MPMIVHPDGSVTVDEEEDLRVEPRPQVKQDQEAPDTSGPRFDFVRKVGSKWIVFSEAGKRLGEYDTEAEANERLRQIEAAKAAKGDK